MILEYIQKAMDQAHYEMLHDNNTFYGEIPLCPGVWAEGKTLEDCRRELQEVLEGWLLLKIKDQDKDLPIINGIIPSISENAFLQGVVTNSQEYALLAGEAAIFHANEYIGTSRIKHTVPNETIELYLGIDMNVKVRHKLVEKYKEHKSVLNDILKCF